MDQKNLLTQALGFIQDQRRRRGWLRIVTCMAAVVVFVTTYLLILPAITMERSTLQITAASSQAASGEIIETEVYAEASDERQETYFVLTADSDGAGLDESRISFTGGGTAVIEDKTGRTFELHRENNGDGTSCFWFILAQGESARFVLPWCDIPDPSGSTEQEGTLKLSFGSGADLKDGQRGADQSIELFWSTEEAEESTSECSVFNDSASTVSQETVEREESILSSDDAAKAVGTETEVSDTLEVPETMEPLETSHVSDESKSPAAAPVAEDGSGHDFADNITNVTVSKLENGQWVPGTEFADGDSVRVEINYTIPANTVGEANKVIYYQLPDGIRLSGEESGIVYDGSKPVGSYIIDTDGMITITFNEDFADEIAFSGMIRFDGTLSAGESGGEQEIEFGGDGGTITVKPGSSPTDIHVEKEGSYDAADGKLHYTVTVSTEKGTEDTVTITDAFGSGNTTAVYDRDSFQIVKINADGNKETVTGYTPEITGDGWSGFTISGLPKLEAGEKYIVTYMASPNGSGGADGASNVTNTATGTSGGNSHSDWNNITISQQMIQKSGYYDNNTGKIKWTITLNTDKKDIGGYVLKDTMTIGDETIAIPAGTVITMTDSEGKSQTITLPYTFPSGSSSTYTITYETNPPAAEPGETWNVGNKAELDGDGSHYEDESTTTGTAQDYGIGKSFDGQDQNSATDAVGTYKWVSRITVPKTDVDLSKLTFTDTLENALNEKGEEVKDSHYITPALLAQLTVTVNGTALERGTDYRILDAEGREITDFTDVTNLTGFQVTFLDPAKEKVAGKTIELRYQTQVDYTRLTGDSPYSIANTCMIPGHESEADTSYEKPRKVEKQASITGEGGSSYTDAPISIDYTASGGIIHYRVLIRTDSDTRGNIILTDLIPKGATLVEDSVKMAFYGNDWYEYDVNGGGYKASEHIRAEISETNEDGTTKVTFTIDDGYNGDGTNHVLVVYYDLSVKDDPLWADDPALDSHLYHNEVTWGSESSGTDVTVEREVPDIKKIGEQLPRYDDDGNPFLDQNGDPVWSNTVRYYVTVNAGAKDLVPGMDYITLWDQLDVGSAAGADFLPDSMKFYRYDHTAENNCGTEIAPELYSYTYDEKEHRLTFTLPDETACVLVYEYVIDRGNAAGELPIRNEAHLTGGTGSGGSTEIKLEETSSDASATKQELTLYKVDAANYGKLLPGAVFSLDAYLPDESTEGSYEWKNLTENLTTDENGQFTLAIADEAFGFQENTLYRLTETKAPAGYTADDEAPCYFVWVETGMSADQVQADMQSSGALDSIDPDSVRFLTASGVIYISNQPTDLTVKKLWQDDNGLTSGPGADSVNVTLYQQATDSNKKTVTVESKGHLSWSQTHTAAIDVAENSGLTIQITGVYKDSLDIKIGSADAVSVPTGSGQVWSYRIDSIPNDITIEISPTDKNEGNSFGSITFSDYTTPYNIPLGDPVKYETITLSKENNWSYTWNNLPMQNKNGQPVYYRVEESPTIPGFEVIYSGNNSSGIQSGELFVINRAAGYVLPETGGPGNFLFTAGGTALMAFAFLMYRILRRKGVRFP